MQLAAGERGLEHVAGVHPALSARSGADQRVQLVDEDDQLVAVLPDLVDDPLQPLLEVAPVPGAGHHAGQLKLDDALARSASAGTSSSTMCWARPSTIAVLPDAGLADQHRIVLAPAGQHLDGLLDLAVAADHRVDPALARQRGQVAAELIQRRRVRPAARAGPGARPWPWPSSAACSASGVRRAAASIWPGRRLGVDGEREQDVLGADVGGSEAAGDLVRVQQRALGSRRQLRWPAAAAVLVLLTRDTRGRARPDPRPRGPAGSASAPACSLPRADARCPDRRRPAAPPGTLPLRAARGPGRSSAG